MLSFILLQILSSVIILEFWEYFLVIICLSLITNTSLHIIFNYLYYSKNVIRIKIRPNKIKKQNYQMRQIIYTGKIEENHEKDFS